MKRPDTQPGDPALGACLIGVVVILFGLFIMVWPTIEKGLNLAVLK